MSAMGMIGNFVAVSDEQLAELMRTPAQISEFLYDSPDLRSLAVDKAWHGIHFLLAGSPWEGDWPLGFIMLGDPIGDVDVGYGPARALTSARVNEVHAALAAIDTAALMAAWDADAIRAEEIYAVNPDDRDGEAEYLGGYYGALKRFIAEASAAGLGMILYIN